MCSYFARKKIVELITDYFVFFKSQLVFLIFYVLMGFYIGDFFISLEDYFCAVNQFILDENFLDKISEWCNEGLFGKCELWLENRNYGDVTCSA